MSEIYHPTNESFVDDVDSGPKVPNKKKTVEEIYQKKTPLEHILIRPDTYVGSIEKQTTSMWIYNDNEQKMVQKNITYVPALYKIFDEILVNAADNKQRDPGMSCIKVDIKPAENMIRVWNNGKGIPVEYHKVEKMYVPTMIFGHLLTSSNYDDTERKVTGGRNGYGAKLCNIFSKKFTVETSNRGNRKSFKQTWIDNMTKASDPTIEDPADNDFTCVTFYPDLKRFGMTEFESDIAELYKRRAFDIAASCPGVKVFLNGKRLNVTSFRDYVDLFLKDPGEDGGEVKVVHEKVNQRWEVAVAASSNGFKQMSFVNSIATTQGGKHVDYVMDQVCAKLVEAVKKKSNKTGVTIKSKDIKNHMQIFVNCLVENPAFASQTKELMVTESKKFGSTCELSEKFINGAYKCGIVDLMMSWVRFKAMEKMDKQCHKAKHTKLKGIPKLDDANDAGTKKSLMCTLILTEGDSAKTLAVAGLGVIGRDNYGVFPLRGKLLNVRDAATKALTENAEINNLIKILGLQYKNKYNNPEDLNTLRYGKVMIMTDQDQDGSHIKGLVINFIHANWPNLLKHNFLEEFITPIVKVFKGKQELSFYSLPEYQEWFNNTPNAHTWRVKYYKGLGTSSSKEAKEYFSDLRRHKIKFRYDGHDDDDSIVMAFSKNRCEDRKKWLTSWMEERRRRTELSLPEVHLYGKDTTVISYHDFVNRELVLFSNLDNERSIPSMVDGFKPGQRKVIFTCFKRNLTKEIKVAQLAGSVSEISAYHHGEVSLMGTIIGLAQDFVGSNNVNLLLPHGQFGTRLNGGKDAASPRYIFTSLNPLTRLIFSPLDDPLLKYLVDDNQRVEPEWYMPIVPVVLLNGAEGIGTGWSTKILNYDLIDIINCLKQLLEDQEPTQLKPCFRGFEGLIEEFLANRYAIFGEIATIDDSTIEITELPVRTWTQSYKESVLEPMLAGTDKVPASILDYKEYHTDKTVRFVVKMSPEKYRDAEAQGLHKYFKVFTTIATNSMVLFDHVGCLKRYNNVMDILKEFFELRLQFYHKRKVYMEGMLTAESSKLENQARFVLEKIEGKIKIENRAKKDLIKLLKSNGYASDPVRKWREESDKEAYLQDLAEQRDEEQTTEIEGEDEEKNLDYHYILNMPLWSLTLERKNDLLAQRDKKRDELMALRKKTPKILYSDDLEVLRAGYEKSLEDAEKDLREVHEKAKKKMDKGAGRGKAVNKQSWETMPNPSAIRSVPKVDAETVKKFADVKVKAAKKIITKKEKSAQDDVTIDEEDDEMFPDKPMKPLLQRISDGGNIMDELMKNGKAKKQAPARKRKTEPAKTAKKAKIVVSDEEADPEKSAKKTRVMAPRAAASSKFVFDTDDEDDNDKDSVFAIEENDASSDGFSPDSKPKKSPAKKPKIAAKKDVQVKPKAKNETYESSDSDFGSKVTAPKKASPAKPRNAKSKRSALSGSDEEVLTKQSDNKKVNPPEKDSVFSIDEASSDGFSPDSKQKKAPAKKPKIAAKKNVRVKAKPKAKHETDESSDSDFGSKVTAPKKASPAKPRNAKSKRSAFSDSEEEVPTKQSGNKKANRLDSDSDFIPSD
ncbi:DNA topoisomerase 2-beta [Cichlidogyrus casuarinus]|uniref:DNA topoisomerase 2 n=1 Tax=Cichlidogyrus casuarinus TaxID=1844966 RepID=A0ABD2QKP1_9PLAT